MGSTRYMLRRKSWRDVYATDIDGTSIVKDGYYAKEVQVRLFRLRAALPAVDTRATLDRVGQVAVRASRRIAASHLVVSHQRYSSSSTPLQ